jgi:hypothetical protein
MKRLARFSLLEKKISPESYAQMAKKQITHDTY